MSVRLGDRGLSKFEVLIFAEELHNMLVELMQRSFGVKDLDHFVRVRYAHGLDDKEDFWKYRYLMQNAKIRIDELAASLTANIRTANTIYAVSMHEYERRRDYQSMAIVDCELIIKELQHIATVFDVDLNLYSRYISAIDREINLIKRWRQRDNRIKSYLQKGNV